jgi:hypothetical protein
MEIRENIAGIPVIDLKKLAIKYLGTDSFKAQQEIALKINVAKCARLSYSTHDGKIDYEKDIQLHDTLLSSKHMSPFEHCARVASEDEYYNACISKLDNTEDLKHRDEYGWFNNFRGFIPYRYLIEN